MRYAGLIRPVIDRVYVGVRHAARDRVRALYDQWELDPGIESDYYFALLDHPVPTGAVEAAMTYRRFEPSREIARGVAVIEDGSWRLTAEGLELAGALRHAIGAAAAELWGLRPIATMPGLAGLERLCGLVGRCLEAGQASGGPAFGGLTPVFEPAEAAAAEVLSSRLGALRHHRGDAHRAAWHGAGYSLADLEAMGCLLYT
ncbi:hypothetical protein, partial [Glycomyces tenuis]|uniref:hypothetical protein n=1 Tax=Glycomyces tenuis TaxID=58116 RepID=UPI00138E46F8